MKMKWVLLVCSFFATSPAFARQVVYHVSGGVMALTNSTLKSGQGPEGSTILSQADAFVSHKFYGGGLFVQYDRQGSTQTDFAFGPKLEIYWKVFFLEGGYAFIMNRNFTDRTVATQKGSGYYYGVGVHVPIHGSIGGSASGRAKGMFLQASYRFRTQKITEQDGVELSAGNVITQQDGYPLFGIGYAF